MSGDNKGKKSPDKDGKVVPLKSGDQSHADNAPAAPSQDGPPSRPQTIEEVGLKLAQDIITGVLKDAKDDEVMAKLLTTSIERHCINQIMMQEVLQQIGQCTVHAQRIEGMASYAMRRQGNPVQLPPAKGEETGAIVFKTWYEEWREMWERWERSQIAAAGGAGNNGKKNGKQPGPKGGSDKGA